MDERAKKNYKEYYEDLYLIGSGGFGVVFKGKEKGKEKNKDELRAIKVINLQKIKENLINENETNTDLKEQLELCIKEVKTEFENMFFK